MSILHRYILNILFYCIILIDSQTSGLRSVNHLGVYVRYLTVEF